MAISILSRQRLILLLAEAVIAVSSVTLQVSAIRAMVKRKECCPPDFLLLTGFYRNSPDLLRKPADLDPESSPFDSFAHKPSSASS